MPSLADHLAVHRTHLANERTVLAYVRTALALGAGGVALVEVFTTPALVGLGWALPPLGALVLLVGVARFRRVRRILRELETEARPAGALE